MASINAGKLQKALDNSFWRVKSAVKNLNVSQDAAFGVIVVTGSARTITKACKTQEEASKFVKDNADNSDFVFIYRCDGIFRRAFVSATDENGRVTGTTTKYVPIPGKNPLAG